MKYFIPDLILALMLWLNKQIEIGTNMRNLKHSFLT